METEHKEKIEKRMKADKKEWEAEVVNKTNGAKITTYFNSSLNTLDEVLHKLKLDLMTNLHFGIISPIEIKIKEFK